MKKCWKPVSQQLAVLIFVGHLAACASAPPAEPPPTIHVQEQAALDAMKVGFLDDAAVALTEAMRDYRKLDNHAGQWRISVLEAKLALRQGENGKAADAAERSLALARDINTAEALYQSYLLAGHTANNPALFRTALSHASTPLQQAVAETYLGNTGAAVQLIDPVAIDNPSDRAFVYYQHGRATGSSEAFLQALGFYRAAEDARGVADSLVSLAKIALKEGRNDRARSYGERAILSLQAAGESDKAEIVQGWLKAL